MPNRIRAVKPAAAGNSPAGFSQFQPARMPVRPALQGQFLVVSRQRACADRDSRRDQRRLLDNFVPEAVVDIQKLKNLAMRILSFLPSVVSNDQVEIKQPTVEMRAFNDKRPPIWQRVQKASSSRLDDQAGMLCEGDFLVKFWDGFLMFFDPSRASCFIPTHNSSHLFIEFEVSKCDPSSETACVTLD